MTFNAYETSQAGGQPVELYEFTLTGETYRYANTEVDYTWGGLVYEALAVKRTNPEKSAEKNNTRLEVKLPSTNLLAQRYITVPPGRKVTLTIYKLHDTDPDEERIVFWKGFLAGAKYTDLVCTFQCKLITEAFKRNTPIFTYQGLCNHVLYDGGCKVSRATFRYTGTVTSITASGLVINGLSGFNPDPEYFNGGFVSKTDSSDHRMILSQSVDTIGLLIPFEDLAVGETVYVQAGCKHDLTTCTNKFSNAANYGGFPLVPALNPFTDEFTD